MKCLPVSRGMALKEAAGVCLAQTFFSCSSVSCEPAPTYASSGMCEASRLAVLKEAAYECFAHAFLSCSSVRRDPAVVFFASSFAASSPRIAPTSTTAFVSKRLPTLPNSEAAAPVTAPS